MATVSHIGKITNVQGDVISESRESFGGNMTVVGLDDIGEDLENRREELNHTIATRTTTQRVNEAGRIEAIHTTNTMMVMNGVETTQAVDLTTIQAGQPPVSTHRRLLLHP